MEELAEYSNYRVDGNWCPSFSSHYCSYCRSYIKVVYKNPPDEDEYDSDSDASGHIDYENIYDIEKDYTFGLSLFREHQKECFTTLLLNFNNYNKNNNQNDTQNNIDFLQIFRLQTIRSLIFINVTRISRVLVPFKPRRQWFPSFNYHQIHNYSWMARNGYINLLIEKLQHNDNQHIQIISGSHIEYNNNVNQIHLQQQEQQETEETDQNDEDQEEEKVYIEEKEIQLIDYKIRNGYQILEDSFIEFIKVNKQDYQTHLKLYSLIPLEIDSRNRRIIGKAIKNGTSMEIINHLLGDLGGSNCISHHIVMCAIKSGNIPLAEQLTNQVSKSDQFYANQWVLLTLVKLVGRALNKNDKEGVIRFLLEYYLISIDTIISNDDCFTDLYQFRLKECYRSLIDTATSKVNANNIDLLLKLEERLGNNIKPSIKSLVMASEAGNIFALKYLFQSDNPQIPSIKKCYLELLKATLNNNQLETFNYIISQLENKNEIIKDLLCTDVDSSQSSWKLVLENGFTEMAQLIIENCSAIGIIPKYTTEDLVDEEVVKSLEMVKYLWSIKDNHFDGNGKWNKSVLFESIAMNQLLVSKYLWDNQCCDLNTPLEFGFYGVSAFGYSQLEMCDFLMNIITHLGLSTYSLRTLLDEFTTYGMLKEMSVILYTINNYPFPVETHRLDYFEVIIDALEHAVDYGKMSLVRHFINNSLFKITPIIIDQLKIPAIESGYVLIYRYLDSLITNDVLEKKRKKDDI